MKKAVKILAAALVAAILIGIAAGCCSSCSPSEAGNDSFPVLQEWWK